MATLFVFVWFMLALGGVYPALALVLARLAGDKRPAAVILKEW